MSKNSSMNNKCGRANQKDFNKCSDEKGVKKKNANVCENRGGRIIINK